MVSLNISLPQLQMFFFVFLRVGAILMAMPVFESRSIPPVFKLGLAFATSLILFPMLKLSPAPLAGAVALQTAEVVAGLVYVNLLNPGHPALFGALPFVSDLRTGSMSGGSAEQGLLMAACAQMAQFYDIPCAVSAGMTDSKLPDFQAGYEKGITELLSALAGANLIYEAAGMYGSLLACSLESFVLDNDLIGGVLRATRGIEVSEETLSFETIRQVSVEGPGHFLGHAQTLDRMQSDYFYPLMGNRETPEEWRESGAVELLERAREQTREMLAAPHPTHISDAVDRRIRETLPIRLSIE